jgi:hypothetical protein
MSNGNLRTPHRQKSLSSKYLSQRPDRIRRDGNRWLLARDGTEKEIICVDDLVRRVLLEWAVVRGKCIKRDFQRTFSQRFEGARVTDVAWILTQLQGLESACTTLSQIHIQGKLLLSNENLESDLWGKQDSISIPVNHYNLIPELFRTRKKRQSYNIGKFTKRREAITVL